MHTLHSRVRVLFYISCRTPARARFGRADHVFHRDSRIKSPPPPAKSHYHRRSLNNNYLHFKLSWNDDLFVSRPLDFTRREDYELCVYHDLNFKITLSSVYLYASIAHNTQTLYTHARVRIPKIMYVKN